MTSPPAFSIAALTPSAYVALPDFVLSIAYFTSFAVDGSVLTSTYSSVSGIYSTSLGASLLRMVSKCVFHSLFVFLHLLPPPCLHLPLECHCF